MNESLIWTVRTEESKIGWGVKDDKQADLKATQHIAALCFVG